MITADSLKIFNHFQNVNACGQKCVLHKSLPTYYAGIMLNAFAILLCSKLMVQAYYGIYHGYKILEVNWYDSQVHVLYRSKSIATP